MFNLVKSKIKFHFFAKQWRQLNKFNETFPSSIFDMKRVSVGIKTYGVLNVIDYCPDEIKLNIGSYCSIAPGVQFLLGGEHQVSSISTYPFKVKCFGFRREAKSKGDITVSDDVWIGTNAIICSGVTIGQGAIIAAGAIVTKDVPPYAIVGGNPAKIIRFRFNKELCDELLNCDIKKIFTNFSRKNCELIYSDLTQEILHTLINP